MNLSTKFWFTSHKEKVQTAPQRWRYILTMSGNFKYLWSSMNQQRKKGLLLKKRRNDFAENENPIVSI